MYYCKLTQIVSFRTCIKEFPASNLGSDTGEGFYGHIQSFQANFVVASQLNNDHFLRSTFLMMKGPAADAMNAPQPWGLVWNPVKKIISFFLFFRIMEHRWNEIDGGKTEVLEEKPVPVPLCPPQIPHGLTPGIEPGPPRWEAGD
jgi:hypothetical protein